MLVVLDSGPLGMLSNPFQGGLSGAAAEWAEVVLTAGNYLAVPEIADYEVRRELIRAAKTTGVTRLDNLKNAFDYLPLSTPTMLLAAQLWASARRAGHPTAADPALDGDVILAAQSLVVAQARRIDVVIATTNPEHLARYAPARVWQDI